MMLSNPMPDKPQQEPQGSWFSKFLRVSNPGLVKKEEEEKQKQITESMSHRFGRACAIGFVSGLSSATSGMALGVPYGLFSSMLTTKEYATRNAWKTHVRSAATSAFLWGMTSGTFTAIDSFITTMRGQREVWTGAVSGAAAGYLLNVRAGQRAGLHGALTFGGLTLMTDLFSTALARSAEDNKEPAP
eukprot:gnl/Trimastix_PCT/2660.p1 GENE.gnl/Trimastix_PCT/2660~~gnl/Trimastix_PCT/2660.p1  ORF type:complete len:188 (+),score=8.33 gnl/Trimastix_PCT/2660:23-586(+)